MGPRAYRQTEPVEIDWPREDCSNCGGSGGGPDRALHCRSCNGTGVSSEYREAEAEAEAEARAERMIDDLEMDADCWF